MNIPKFFRIYIKQIFVILSILTVIVFIPVVHKTVDRFSLRIDLTENKLYQLSDTSLNILTDLDIPVNITVFSREENYVIMLKEILNKYKSLSSKINLDYIDPYENPVLIDKYATKGFQIKPDNIVVDGKGKTKVFSVEDMYNFSAGNSKITGMKAEQQLTGAILYVNNPVIPTAAFVDGHNERPSNSLISLFRDNNYEILRGDLRTLADKSPDILVIAAPSRDYNPDEKKIIEEYFNRGGNAIIFLEPSAMSFPVMESIIEERGVRAGNELVLEDQVFTGGNKANIVPMYAPHEINRYFMDTHIYLTMPSSRSLYILDNPGSAFDIRTVLTSTPLSYGKKGYQFTDLQKNDEDITGPFALAVSSEKELSSGISRALVIGSRNIFEDDLMGYSSYANSEFIVQALNWLNPEKQSVHIEPKQIGSEPIFINAKSINLFGILFCGVIPFCIFITGILVFIKRKRL